MQHVAQFGRAARQGVVTSSNLVMLTSRLITCEGVATTRVERVVMNQKCWHVNTGHPNASDGKELSLNIVVFDERYHHGFSGIGDS